ncbi:invasin domain 3-containing protein [Cohnella hashimotonis]|uniref:Invasin domain 3-containing protein n=1 Tax=Cohnella hashimotonis TaxID=2826895 RepID=A0ABT6TTN3_9BACL|nr:invasin domain 3-containing protein [Cohnella hashimotonis]MDI4649876.1 invasin domain 3-containing protein [Cohnella hashimotonis]
MSDRNIRQKRNGSGLTVKLMLVAVLFASLVPYGVHSRAFASAYDGTIDADRESLPADGASRTSVTLLLADDAGNPVSLPAEQVRFTTTLGSFDDSVTVSGDGRYESMLTAPTMAGVALIRAEVGGVVLSDMARVSFGAGAPSATTSTIESAHASIPGDGVSRTLITLRLKDRYGNAVSEPADSMQLFATLGTLDSVTHATYGRYEAELVSSEYGHMGDWSSEPGPVGDLAPSFTDGAIPADLPEGSDLPVTVSLVYRTDGVYLATLTSEASVGVSEITASLNGEPLAASVRVEFTDPETTPTPTPTTSATPTPTPTTSATPTPTPTTSATPTPTPATSATPTPTPTTSATPTPTTSATPTPTPTSANTPQPATPTPTPAALSLQDEQGNVYPIAIEAVQKGLVELRLPENGGTVSIPAADIGTLRKINPQAVLDVSAGAATMRIPLSEFDAASYGDAFGMSEDSIVFAVNVGPPDEALDQAIRQKASNMQARVLGSPTAFEVSVTGGNGRSVFLSAFKHYLTRSLPLGTEEVPRTATGVRWLADTNEFAFVPTNFSKLNDGTWTANMMRPGASIYTVIDRPAAFADIGNHWAADDIGLLASKLLVQGRSSDAFAPNATLTRAEIAVLLVRALGLNESTAASPFKDVRGGWYGAAVSTAYQAGLLTGYQDGTFRPQRKITREELVVMLMRAMRYPGADTIEPSTPYQRYGDETAISRWAAEDIKEAQAAGIVQAADAFRPESDSSRAEAVAMLARMLRAIHFI